MNWSSPTSWFVPAATDGMTSFTAREFDIPDSPGMFLACVAGLLLLVAIVVAIYVRDTRGQSRWTRLWLTTLRLGTIAIAVFIFLNWRERTQRQSFRPSRVAFVIDTSLSMGFPESIPSETQTATNPSRAAAVTKFLSGSGLINDLRETHDVAIYTFHSQLTGPHAVLPALRRENRPADSIGGESAATSIDHLSAGLQPHWSDILQPSGLETRLGESLQELIRQISGRTLSGIVVVTDGSANAGIEPQVAHELARAAGVRLVTLGVGSTDQPVNVQVSGIQTPTDVQMGDPYDIVAFVQGEGLPRQAVEVELLARTEGDDQPPVRIDAKAVELLEDGIPVEARFTQTPVVAGSVEYFIRAKPVSGVAELSRTDNERRRTVRIVERKLRVMLVAGGPGRDYRFVRNMLFRHPGMEVDVWLQTVAPRTADQVSQESKHLLTTFPQNAGELSDYDVIVGFDPDWRLLTDEQRTHLRSWVSEHAGGLVLVAGDVHTPELASAADQMEEIQELYPVFLNPMIIDLQLHRDGGQAWPFEFTPDGRDAGFLLLSDSPAATVDLWLQFDGVYRCYPTGGARAGSTVFAHFSDPRMETENGQPILLATQYFGAGRTMFIGSTEMWRLRAVSDEYYERFWTKIIREIGQGRLKRGNSRGMLMLERNEYALGQTVRLRARLYNAQLEPLDQQTVTMTVFDPQGRPLNPSPTMVQDQNQAGRYAGSFRAGQQGTWAVEVEIPDTGERLRSGVEVIVPNLESQHPQQNAKLLVDLARDTGGTYLTLNDAGQKLPELLPDRSQQVMIDERLRTLWDRQWLLYLLIGLLSAEWLTRKLLKMA